MIETDPFTLVFNTLWQMADNSLSLTNLVRPGNKIRFNIDDDRSPIKENVADADLPELILATAGITNANMFHSSCDSLIVRQYQWLISTGDLRTNFRLFPVQFALYCAMHSWQGALSTLLWKNKKFVKNTRWLNATEGITNPQLNRGIEGWSSIWNISVEMIFSSTDLIAINQEP